MPSDATRESLLSAAERVMRRDGAGNLTLDAVAREAGVSKGGLLYHFPSKADLLRAIVAEAMRQAEAEVEQHLGPDPARGAFARHFLSHSMKKAEASPGCKPEREMVWSMLAAAANDPLLLLPVQEQHAKWQRRLEAELDDPDLAALVRLVGHGLWSTEMFGFHVPDEAQRERIAERLCRLAGIDTMEDH